MFVGHISFLPFDSPIVRKRDDMPQPPGLAVHADHSCQAPTGAVHLHFGLLHGLEATFFCLHSLPPQLALTVGSRVRYLTASVALRTHFPASSHDVHAVQPPILQLVGQHLSALHSFSSRVAAHLAVPTGWLTIPRVRDLTPPRHVLEHLLHGAHFDNSHGFGAQSGHFEPWHERVCTAGFVHCVFGIFLPQATPRRRTSLNITNGLPCFVVVLNFQNLFDPWTFQFFQPRTLPLSVDTSLHGPFFAEAESSCTTAGELAVVSPYIDTRVTCVHFCKSMKKLRPPNPVFLPSRMRMVETLPSNTADAGVPSLSLGPYTHEGCACSTCSPPSTSRLRVCNPDPQRAVHELQGLHGFEAWHGGGQFFSPQASSSSEPQIFLSPFLTVRVRRRYPPPQVAVHLAQLDQAPTLHTGGGGHERVWHGAISEPDPHLAPPLTLRVRRVCPQPHGSEHLLHLPHGDALHGFLHGLVPHFAFIMSLGHDPPPAQKTVIMKGMQDNTVMYNGTLLVLNLYLVFIHR